MSKSLRGWLLTAIFSAGCGGVFASAPAHAETLADAIALAYETNPTLQQQRATQRALDETYVQARSGWRPTLSLSAAANYSESRTPRFATLVDTDGDGVPDTPRVGSTTFDESNSASAGLSFSQPIWTGGRTAAAVSAATADILQGRENLRRVEAGVISSVIQAYADTRRDMEGLRIRQENVAVLQRQLQESQARFDVGEITRTDVAQSQARLAASQAQLQSAQAQLGISRAAYAAAVGRNPGDLAPEPSLAYLLPATVDEAFAVAEEFNPNLRAQRFAEQASRARVAGARAERMPTVSLRAGLNYGGPADPFDRERFGREVTGSAVVTVPLFSGGLVSSRIRQNVDRNNADRIGIEGQRRSVLQNVAQSWNLLIASRANIGSTEEQARAARIAAEGTRQEQQVGLRTTIDVLNAEQELRSAELNQVTARRDEYVAAATVLSAMGRLEARNLTPTVPQYDAKGHFRKLRITWGWVPWEEPIAILDSVLTPQPREKAVEPTIAPGLQPPPAAPVSSAPRS